MRQRLVITRSAPIKFDTEDAGTALIAHLDDGSGADVGWFVRLQSWDPERKHATLRRFKGKRVRVTIEEVP